MAVSAPADTESKNGSVPTTFVRFLPGQQSVSRDSLYSMLGGFHAHAPHKSNSSVLACRVLPSRLNGLTSRSIEFEDTNRQHNVPERRLPVEITPWLLCDRICRRRWSRPAHGSVAKRNALR